MIAMIASLGVAAGFGLLETHRTADIAGLPARTDGFLWVDVPAGDNRRQPRSGRQEFLESVVNRYV